MRRIRHIEAAGDERDLRVSEGVHYERFKGKDSDKDSMRLNEQWRLILTIETDEEGKYVLVHDVSKHYGK